jgi:predicted MFS family arabinose efflux permease
VSSSLSSPQLRRIVVAYTVNRLGTWIGLLALVIAVYDHTHSSLAVAALMFAGLALPAFAVPTIVARAEASRRRSELTALYVFEAVVTAGLAVLVWHFELAAGLVLVALDGTAALAASALLRAEVARAAREQLTVGRTDAALANGAPQGPLTVGTPDAPLAAATPDGLFAAGELPAEVDRHEAERKANAALNVAFSTTFVLGPVIGGAIVAAAGAPAALFVDVASFLACGALVLDLHPHVEEAAGESVRERVRAAWRHINEAPALRALLLAQTVAYTFVETGAPIEVPYVKATLHAGDSGLGLVLTMWGAGAVLGSIVFARLIKRPLGEMLGAGTLLIGLAYLGLAAARSLELACVAALVGGVGNGLQWPSLISIVQKASPEHLHGRMMGAVESLGAICLGVGLPLGGLLAALTSPRTAFLIVGIGAVAMTAVLIRLSGLSVGKTAQAQDDEPAAPREGAAAALPKS